MRANRSRHIVALVSLVVFLLAGHAGTQGFVWCLGDDGRTALEYAAGDTCSPGEQEWQGQDCHDEQVGDFSPQEENCGPCFDLPASIEAASRSIDTHKNFKVQVGLPTVSQADSGRRLTRLPAGTPCPRTQPRISRSILLQRTVVFLI